MSHCQCNVTVGSIMPSVWEMIPTVKFLNFRTQENFAVIILKLEKRGFTIE